MARGDLGARLRRLEVRWPAPLPAALAELTRVGAALLGIDEEAAVAQATKDMAVAQAAGEITAAEVVEDARHVVRLDEAARRAWTVAALRGRGLLP